MKLGGRETFYFKENTSLFKGEWRRPWCWQGRCYTGQKYAECEDKENGHQLGDGTWCFNKSRDTVCPTGTNDQ